MEPVDVGILSLLPPIIAISLALITKEVISSLMLGILSGGLLYAAASGGGLVDMSSAAFEIMSKTVGTPDKFNIILFLALLGALVCVVNKAGGSQAYGNWATQKITSRQAAELATSILGILIFIDDYFNCLTVGTVMKPVTDKYRISRAKLAIPPQPRSVSSLPSPAGQQQWGPPFMKPVPFPTKWRLFLPPSLTICMPSFPS